MAEAHSHHDGFACPGLTYDNPMPSGGMHGPAHGGSAHGWSAESHETTPISWSSISTGLVTVVLAEVEVDAVAVLLKMVNFMLVAKRSE